MSQEIEASRETDERIARGVMGWTYGRWHGVAHWFQPGHNIPDNLRRWSTDRSAALEVVDRLTEAGLRVVIKVAATGTRVDVTDTMGDGIIFANADGTPSASLPLAIARAALNFRVLDYLKSRAPLGGA